MATDLVSEIVEVVSPTISSRIASALGLDPATVQKAIVVAAPVLIGALISNVSKAQGANKLIDVVKKQEPGLLSSLANVIGEPGQKGLIDQGASVLTSLLGGKTFSGLSQAVGQYSGIGEGGAKSLLGLLGPVVLGVLGREQRDRGLDASGLANLLISQKNNVSAASPAGFSRYLREAGIPDDVIASRARVASQPPASASPSIWPWLLGALILLGLGALAWNLLHQRHKQVVETANPPVEGQMTSPNEAPYAGFLARLQGIKVGDVDVGQLTTSAVNDLSSSLAGVKDEATAQSSMPGLTKASSEFDQLACLTSSRPKTESY